MDDILPRMMEAAGITEELKARDPMRWVGLMNTLKAQAEEVVLSELVFDWLDIWAEVGLSASANF